MEANIAALLAENEELKARLAKIESKAGFRIALTCLACDRNVAKVTISGMRACSKCGFKYRERACWPCLNQNKFTPVLTLRVDKSAEAWAICDDCYQIPSNKQKFE